jgi:hypothetical protein
MNQEWQQLADAYASNGIALVLGAGVSYSSKIPSWNDLLRSMVTKHVSGATEQTFDRLRQSGLSLTVIASLLEEHAGSRLAFVEAVRDALYADFPFYGTKVDKHNRRDFIRFIRQGQVGGDGTNGANGLCGANLTLRSIGALCVVRRWESRGQGQPAVRNVANPKIRAIVTLNLDALLQTYVSAFSTRRLIRTVERPCAEPYADRINLYHMHGYLHFARGEQSRRREAVESVVLTEQDYYDFFNQPNSMFNYTFLYMLREHSCLFIGLSMEDENIRRLLHYSKLERLGALANKSGKTLEQLVKKNGKVKQEVTRHFTIMQHSKDLQVDLAKQETLEPLGVHVLWVDDFSEIPAHLQELYESSAEDQGRWAEVYNAIY